MGEGVIILYEIDRRLVLIAHHNEPAARFFRLARAGQASRAASKQPLDLPSTTLRTGKLSNGLSNHSFRGDA
jgi:hypothetical protein